MCAKEIAVGVYASAAAHVVSCSVRLYVGLYPLCDSVQLFSVDQLGVHGVNQHDQQHDFMHNFAQKRKIFFAGLRPAPRWGSRPRPLFGRTPPSVVTGRRPPGFVR